MVVVVLVVVVVVMVLVVVVVVVVVVVIVGSRQIYFTQSISVNAIWLILEQIGCETFVGQRS